MAEITVVCSDGAEFQLTQEQAQLSGLLKNLLEDADPTAPIPLASVSGPDMQFVVRWMQTRPSPRSAKTRRVGGLLDDLDPAELIRISNVADFLDIPALLRDTIKYHHRNITTLTAEEFRGHYKLPGDLTAQEQAVVAKENEHAADPKNQRRAGVRRP